MKRKPSIFRKIRRIVVIVLLSFVVLLGVLLLPATQTFLAKRITSSFAERFDTQVNLGKISISPFGYATLNDVLALDHRQDTLIYIGTLDVPALRLRAVFQGDNNLGKVSLRNVKTNIITYKGEEKSNMDIFFEALKKDNKREHSSTLFNVAAISLTTSNLLIANQNSTKNPLLFSNLNADIENFGILDDTIEADIIHLDTKTSLEKMRITSLSGHYLYSPTQMLLSDANIQTPSSILDAEILLKYPKYGLQQFYDKVVIDLDIQNAALGEEDVTKIFSNATFGAFDFSGIFKGTLNDFTLSNASIQRENTDLIFSLKSQKFLDKSQRYLSGAWALSTSEIMRLLPKTISNSNRKRIEGVGIVSTQGKFTLENAVWRTTTLLNTSLGKLDIKAKFQEKITKPTYTFELRSDSFNIGALTTIPTLGASGLDITLSGTGFDTDRLEAQALGTLTNFVYRDYVYDKVVLSGKLNPKQFNGTLSVSDNALDLELNGDIDFAAVVRNFSFTAAINRADFSSLGWIPESITGNFSGDIDLALQGNTIDEMIGDLYIEQGKLVTPQKTHVFSNLAAQSRLINDVRVINLSSEDVASGLMIGKFKPTELSKLIQNALGSQYKNFTPNEVSPEQYVDFNFNIKGKIATALLGEDVIVDDNTFVKGKINSDENRFKINIRAPLVGIKNTIFTDANLQIDTKNPLYHSLLTIDELTSGKMHFFNINWINSKIKDKLYGRAEFVSANSPENTNQFNTSFTINEKSEMLLAIQSADFFFNNKRWQLDKKSSPTLTAINKNEFTLSPAILKSGTSVIAAEASQRGEKSFSLNLNFEQMALGDVLSFERDNWEGIVDGFLNIQQSDTGFSGDSNLKINSLSLNKVPLGNAFLTLESQKQQDYKLDFRLEENTAEVIRATGTVGINEYKPVWDINAVFNDYNLAILQGLTQGVFTPFEGKANGTLQLLSQKDELVPKGVLYVDDFILGVPYLNTKYTFEKVVPFVFEKDEIRIADASFSSDRNQYGNLDGKLQHSSFLDWRLDMNIEADNLKVLATEFSETALYYGNAFLSGNAHLSGSFSNMQIEVVGQTAPNTNLFIPIQYDTAIGDVSFINFVSKETSNERNEVLAGKVEGLQLYFDLDVTPDAEVEIVVDPETKSSLRGKGAGNILLEIDTTGSFAIWGDFIALDGEYNFKNLGLIDKDFLLRPGGTIVWDGDPYGAQINMQAVYNVPGGANPVILLEGDNVSQKIPTEVTVNLFGNLLNPETPTFEIDFPNASGVMKNELNYRLNDQERRQLQAISLLSQGAFINEVSLAAISSQTLTNNLFQKASGIFDNIFTSSNDKLNLSLNYLQGDRNAAVSLKNRDRLGVSLSTNINERILIDGKVGVPVGGDEETTIIGNFKVEFLLNPSGTLRGRVFNRENEFQYFGDDLGFTQGVGLNYQVRFNSFNALMARIFNKKESKTF